MRCQLLRYTILCLAISVGSAATAQDNEKAKRVFDAAEVAFFKNEVLPLLKANCFKCHGGEPKVKGGLRLTSREGVMAGGELGAVINRDKPAESQLLAAINYEDLEMPPSGKLSADKIAVLTKWVKLGAPWGGVKDYGVAPAATDERPRDDGKYWAYQPIRRPQPPAVRNVRWVKGPIDAFLLARLEGASLQPAPRADKVALIRRAYYDLTGLPPTPEAVDRFVVDDSPQAWEHLIDRLLDSPQYGQRWGRFWLDLVRYAETHGYERDSAKPFAWRYRDYVIDAFNTDKPYDRFLLEQLAGDELEPVTAETLTATGFYRLGIWDDEPADRLLARYDGLDDVLRTTSEVVLGMTIGCARCHDHKGDPLPQLDYYRMLAYFHDIAPMNRENLRNWVADEERLAYEKRLVDKRDREGRWYSEIYAIEQQFLAKLREKTGPRAINARPSDLDELRFRFYRDTWEELPDFDSLKPETEGVIADNLISLRPASRGEAIGLVFQGTLQVPQTGEYTFAIDAAEGVRLLIGGAKVIERSGKGVGRVEGKVQLKAGPVALRLEYFNSYAKPKLEVSWSGPSVKRRALSHGAGSPGGPTLLADSRKQGQVWKYTLEPVGADWNQTGFDDGQWKKGPGGFGARGTPGSVVRTEWRTANIWLRRSFQLDEVPAVLTMWLHHDEDVEVYLNGVLVHSAKGYAKAYKRTPLGEKAIAVLKTGENVVAVHCRQTGGGQYIDVGLEASGEFDLAAMMRKQGADLIGAERLKTHAERTRQLAESREAKIAPPQIRIMSVSERGRTPTHLLVRGNPHAKGARVEPATPAALKVAPPSLTERPANAPSTGKRLALAKWLADKQNPLTARVFVNRLWQAYFGRGIVPTANDFGKFGQPPTHPDLLDWLASEFRDGGWKIKRMHKMIMLSGAYQMSSRASERELSEDPENRLFWRHNMRRLTSEEIRDSVLAITGELNLKLGGPSIYVPIAQEVLRGQSRPGAGWGKSPPEEANRRSVYIHLKRSLLVPILEMHDQADTDSSCPVRFVTTVPTQSLGMLNGGFTNEKARKLAERLQRDAPKQLKDQVRRAVRLSTSRTPGEQELAADVAFIGRLQREEALSAKQALAIYCLLTLNANEFVYLD